MRIRRELIDLAKRYDRRGEYFDPRSRQTYLAARGRLPVRHRAAHLGRQTLALVANRAEDSVTVYNLGPRGERLVHRAADVRLHESYA
jgi:hypothetical protein